MFDGVLQNVPYSGNISVSYIAQRTAVSTQYAVNCHVAMYINFLHKQYGKTHLLYSCGKSTLINSV